MVIVKKGVSGWCLVGVIEFKDVYHWSGTDTQTPTDQNWVLALGLEQDPG